MRTLVEIEDIEDMRRRQGIEDVELREGIRRLRAGDFVKLTLHCPTAPSAGQTLRVRITSVRGETFRGKLADRPAAGRLPGLRDGSPLVFTAAHIHSVAREGPHSGPERGRPGEEGRSAATTPALARVGAAKAPVSGVGPRAKNGTATPRETHGPTRAATTLRRTSRMLSSYPVTCPHRGCGWAGSLVPSAVEGGGGAEIASGQAAWFECPRCERSWELRIRDDRVTRTRTGVPAGDSR